MGTTDALAALQRWEASGAAWVLRDDDPATGEVVVDLLSCDGGDVVGRLASAAPGFVAHVRRGGAAPAGDRD